MPLLFLILEQEKKLKLSFDLNLKFEQQQRCIINQMKGRLQVQRAIPFITKKPNSQEYHLTPQAQQILKSIDKPLSIISVAGQYRTGKSYLLNSVILDKKSIFGVGPTTNACTKGLWLWIEPDPLDKSRMMLVIDTQGLAALDEESNHDMKIFCLAVLLSTTFIYNSFGNIDETALQTLSLVLNLVSTIDKQSLSTRPQFMWIVRDFSLQLIDGDGHTISSKQYLDMALTTNSKQSQKQMIRNTIVNAFPERDCFTLIKPLIDQLKLQNLDNIDIDDLRPQFVSQSIELRNRIKSSLRSFKLNGRDELKGKDYAIVIKKYLNAINNGAVPNIVDTWTFIKEEKRKEAIQEIKKVYAQKIQYRIIEKIPTKNQNIQKLYTPLRQQIRAEYLRMTYDEESTAQIQEYLQKMIKQIYQHNQQETSRTIKKIAQKQFEPFRKKLYSDYYSNYDQFQTDIKRNYRDSCIQKYEERLQSVKQTIERFTDMKIIESYRYFQKKLKAQVHKQTHLKDEVQKTAQYEMENIKQTLQRQKKDQYNKTIQLEKQVKVLSNEKNQLLEMAKTEKSIVENNTENVKRKNKQLSNNVEEVNMELRQTQIVLNETKEKLFLETKENQKEKALFHQKQEYWNKKNQDLQKKYKELQQKYRENLNNYERERKEMMNGNNTKVHELEKMNKNIMQKLSQTESQLHRAMEDRQRIQYNLEDMKRNTLSEKKMLQNKIVQAESNKKPTKMQYELKKQNDQLYVEIQNLTNKSKQVQSQFKLIKESKKTMESNYQNQIAIHIQQIQFKEIQLKDLKERYQELKKSHQQTLQNLNDTSKSFQENNQMRIFQISTQHQKQIESLEQQFQSKMDLMKQEMNMLQKHKEQLSLQISLDKKQHEAKEKQWKQSHTILESMCEKLQKKLKLSERDYEDFTKEKQNFYSLRVKQLEEEIEVVKEKASQDVDQIQKKSQQAYAVLKHYSELEKEQWQKRIGDQKQKNSKKIQVQKEEFEKKMNDQKQAFEEELSELQSRLAHMDRIYNERIQNMQYDNDIKIQKLTNTYMEEKVELNKQIALCKQKMEITKNNLERQLTNKTKYYEEQLQSIRSSLAFEYELNIKKLKEQKENIDKKYDNVKKNNRQLEQSNLILKNENEKDKAIFKEKQINYEHKISQVENRLQNELISFNKAIESIQQKNEQERERLNFEIERLNVQKLDLEEEKNKLEGQFENEKKRLQNAVQFNEKSKQKYKADYDDIMEKFSLSVKKLNEDKNCMNNRKKSEIQNLNIEYEQRIKQFEQKYNRMIKDSEDRVARFTLQNRSLKDRISNLELQKSMNSNRSKGFDEGDKAIFEKKIQDLKSIIQLQKENISKCRCDWKFEKQKSDFTERNSFINDLSPGNSRIYQGQGENRPLMGRKSNTSTTPLINKKSRRVDINQFGGIMKHNEKYH